MFEDSGEVATSILADAVLVSKALQTFRCRWHLASSSRAFRGWKLSECSHDWKFGLFLFLQQPSYSTLFTNSSERVCILGFLQRQNHTRLDYRSRVTNCSSTLLVVCVNVMNPPKSPLQLCCNGWVSCIVSLLTRFLILKNSRNDDRNIVLFHKYWPLRFHQHTCANIYHKS